MITFAKSRLSIAVIAIVYLATIWPVAAEQLFRLRNGMILRGSVAEIATLKDGFGAAAAGEIHVRPIWLIDDGLRRIYIHGNGMAEGDPIDVADLEQSIEIWQPTPLGGKVVQSLGSVLELSRFNKVGRRNLTLRSSDGPYLIHQGITELNSRFAKVNALKGKPSLVWDMRVATSSLDSPTLKTILEHMVDDKDLDGRLRNVRFFISAERYDDAHQLLAEVIKDFPEEVDMQAQLAALTEQQAAQLLKEAETRAEAGQPRLARDMLNEFPLHAVGRLTRLQVQDALGKLNESRDQAKSLVELLRQQVKQIAQSSPQVAMSLEPIVDEIESGLSDATLARLSDYTRLGNTDTLPVDNRVALAIAGWLLGSGSGEQNLTVAVSLIRVRELVAEYLASPDPLRRDAILEALRNLEGAEPEYVDRMLPLMLPPLPLPEDAEDETFAGMYTITVGQQRYVIQLPPQYDPLRQYPCIVGLHEARASPQTQIDWWAGDRYSEKLQSRLGHASRYGFIVVAPVWARDSQRAYEYTPREHQRILICMRDAMRRASIDADRVFLAGHGEGGTAAWDVALAHPDLWAGMISLSGSPSIKRTVPHYEPNSRYMPMYMVMGEKDGNRAAGTLINDYMTFNHDAMVVMYRGRGREYFYEEMPRLFEWMRLSSHTRQDPPREIETATMRKGDQFFWWLELGELKPDVEMDPILWDQAKRVRRAGIVSGKILEGNQVRVSGPSDQYRVLLRPQPGIDINDRILVRYGRGGRKTLEFDGTLDVMLEDVRRRADRKRPFWLEASLP
jgi:predicted esterase